MWLLDKVFQWTRMSTQNRRLAQHCTCVQVCWFLVAVRWFLQRLWRQRRMSWWCRLGRWCYKRIDRCHQQLSNGLWVHRLKRGSFEEVQPLLTSTMWRVLAVESCNEAQIRLQVRRGNDPVKRWQLRMRLAVAQLVDERRLELFDRPHQRCSERSNGRCLHQIYAKLGIAIIHHGWRRRLTFDRQVGTIECGVRDCRRLRIGSQPLSIHLGWRWSVKWRLQALVAEQNLKKIRYLN